MDQVERRRLVDKFAEIHGFDFFMVDTRQSVIVKAAPFHIGNLLDVETFSRYASRFIPWKPSQNAVWSQAADARASAFARKAVEKIA